MLEKLISYLLYGNLFCGIEHTDHSGEDVLYVTLLKKQKNTIDVSKIFQVKKIDELTSLLKKNQHAILIINTEQVLTKKIESSNKQNLELVFSFFPNIKIDAFYYEIHKQDNLSYVSICRKDYVDELILEYSKNGIVITGFYLGNLLVSGFSEFIGQTIFYTSNATIQKKGALIEDIALDAPQNQIEYDINGIKTNNHFLLSLAGALSHVLKRYAPNTNAVKEKELLFSEFKQLRFFNVFLKFGLGAIFIALLLNYFLFDHYLNNVNELQAISSFNKTTSQKIIALKKEVDSIQKLAEDMLQMESSKSSFFINDIMQGLPSSIVLSELNYQPLIKNIKENDPIINDLHRMLIGGVSTSSETFSVWVSQLEKLNWVSKVEILDYNDVTASSSNFNIKLSLSP